MVNMNRLFFVHTVRRMLSRKSFRGKKYVNQLLIWLTPIQKDNIIVKTKYRFKLKISPLFDKGIERSIFDNGVYEDGTLWCFTKILKKNYVVIDAGANIGLTTIHAGKLVGDKGSIYAFEPMRTTYDILCYNIKLNKLGNIFPINVALSNYEGNVEIFDNLNINRGAASLFSDKRENGLMATVTTLDKIAKEYSIKDVDFIKIDIEGSEYPMLLGGGSFFEGNKKPMVCVEFSRDVKSDYDPELIFDFMKNTHNYRIFKQLNGKETQSPLIEILSKKDLPNHDNIYCFKDYHFERLPNDLFFNQSL
jgi:FkbM family methyltransferase